MKHILLIALSFVLLNLVTHAKAAVGSSLKVEGTCSGSLQDGTAIALTYYSDFDGCKKVSKSALGLKEGLEGLFTGSRVFRDGKDIYNFPKNKLTLDDSTGNTSADFEYRDQNNELQSVELQCEVRDYEYGECY